MRLRSSALLVLLAGSLFAGCTCGSLPGRTALRPHEHAGDWYPAEPDALRDVLDRSLAEAQPAGRRVRALVVPHAGFDFTAAIAGKAWGAVRDQRFDRVVVLAPSHRHRVEGAYLPAEGGYLTPLGPLRVDEEALAVLERPPLLTRRATPYDGENSVELLLPWIAHLWPNAKVLPVLVGRIDETELEGLTQALRDVLDDRTLLAVSSDFAHTGDRFGSRLVPPDTPKNAVGPVFLATQQPAIDALRVGDEAALVRADRDGRLGICGINTLRLLARLVGAEADAEITATGSSIPIWFSHADGEVIGYASLIFPGRWPAVPGLDPAAREQLVELTRATLEAVASKAEPPPVPKGPPVLERPGRAFVTLNQDGELRACMGWMGDDPLAESVRIAAKMTASEDPRFPPITPAELERLEVELSVLGALTPMADPLDFEPGRHGLLLTRGDAASLLLPQVAAQFGMDREAFLRTLAEKAGLEPDGWREAELERFSVESILVARPEAPPLEASASE